MKFLKQKLYSTLTRPIPPVYRQLAAPIMLIVRNTVYVFRGKNVQLSVKGDLNIFETMFFFYSFLTALPVPAEPLKTQKFELIKIQ